jgi:hypothetical protein
MCGDVLPGQWTKRLEILPSRFALARQHHTVKGRNGTAELLRIIADRRVSPAVCGILELPARQYGAIGTEITPS